MEDDYIHLAGCVITDDYGRVLLMHRYEGTSQWELPGGKVEEGETPAQAAPRELLEELDVTVAIRRLLGRESFELHGNQYMYHWFGAVIVGGEPTIMETDKFDDLDFFELEDLPSLALSPNMQILGDKLFSGEIVLDTAAE